MNVLDYLLDGVEAELALERELGVRLVECDRELLKPLPNQEAAADVRPAEERHAARPSVGKSDRPIAQQYDFVFLHDRPLTAGGVEMMAKIAGALGKTLTTAPVACEGERPPAKAYIVLGALALNKWFPGLKAAPGQWVSAHDAPNIIVTYSPAYILRFAQVTPTLQKIKKDMWAAIKSVLQRIAL